MSVLKRFILVLILLGFFPSFLSAQEKLSSPIIPRDVLFGNPERAAPQISPDGTQLGYLASVNGVLNVWIRTIGKKVQQAYRPKIPMLASHHKNGCGNLSSVCLEAKLMIVAKNSYRAC
jgi:hypothetical protein